MSSCPTSTRTSRLASASRTAFSTQISTSCKYIALGSKLLHNIPYVPLFMEQVYPDCTSWTTAAGLHFTRERVWCAEREKLLPISPIREQKSTDQVVPTSSGSVCLDVINQTWSPMYDMINIFEAFLPHLLRYPNPSDPLNGEAAALMLRDPKGYDAKVRGRQTPAALRPRNCAYVG